MYGIIALISAWIRQFYLPNPFVNIIDPLYADLFNIIIGGFIIHILAYYITGCIYEKGSSPGLGSFLYLINYIVISGLIILITKYIKVIVSKEVYVGSYRCDLVAIDESTGIKVIIENQLESSNHDHLGKIITYASGLNAQVVVWIVTHAKEEHKSAIEWLNNNTNGDVNFFLIELHAYKIGDSLPAPYFEVVEKPNDFIKNTKVNGDKSELNKSQSERLEFWNQFNDVLIENGKPFNVRKATTDHWYDVAIGTSAAHIGITLVNKESYIGVEFYINDDKEMFDKLLEKRSVIEEELGFKLDWQRLENRSASRIKYYIKGLNFDDHSNYDELIDKTITVATKMRDVFKKYI